MSNREISRNELLPGDVLLFEPTDDHCSQLVAVATHSNVSHSALVHRNNNVIEMVVPNIASRPIRTRLHRLNRLVYVMRPTFSDRLDMAPVMNIAQEHVNRLEPYPYSDLIGALIVLLLQDWIPEGGFREFIVQLLRAVTAHIVNFFNRVNFPGQMPMVCSQFVDHCFRQAGSEFDLGISDMRVRVASRISTRPTSGSMLQRVRTAHRRDLQAIRSVSNSFPSFRLEDACESLVNWLRDEQRQNRIRSAPTNATVDADFSAAVAGFIGSIVNAGAFNDGRRQNVSNENAIDIVLSNRSMFVTPADLLRAATNLNQIGVIRA